MKAFKIKNLFSFLYLIACIVLISSCTQEDELNDNLPPSIFNISLEEVTNTQAKISWTESIDPEETIIVYDVLLNGEKLGADILETYFEFNNLDQNVDYIVKIVAKDEDGNTTVVERNFSTGNNQPPSLFQLSMTSINPFSSKVKWTESIDPEGTEVTYRVFLNDELLESDIFSLEYSFESLKGLENYIIRVEAKDNDGRITGVELPFTTTIKIYDDDLDLETQSFVESIGNQGYNQINGDLNIGSLFSNPSDVNDLSSLSSLIAVNGNLTIRKTECTTLQGLQNMELLGDLPRVKITKNNNLIDLEGLNSIQSVCEIEIIHNENLEVLSGLESLFEVECRIEISTNPKLSNIEALSTLHLVLGTFYIGNNDSLTTLEGLESINTAMSITICCNQNLVSLKGLDNLMTSSGELAILDNYSLQNLDHLSQFTSTFYLKITDNFSLVDISGLENLNEIHNNFEISRNENLTSLIGLQNITFSDNQSNYHEIIIRDNNTITNLDPFSNYFFERGRIRISNNIMLTDLCGLSNLILNMTDFMNDHNFAIGNGFNPGIVQMQNGDCAQ